MGGLLDGRFLLEVFGRVAIGGGAGIEPAIVGIAAETSRRLGPKPGLVRGALGVAQRHKSVGLAGSRAEADCGRIRMIRQQRFHPRVPPTRAIPGNGLVVVGGVNRVRGGQLLQIADAGDALGLELGRRQSRQQQRREYRDDGNDHQQLDESERAQARPISLNPKQLPAVHCRRVATVLDLRIHQPIKHTAIRRAEWNDFLRRRV